MGDLLKKMGKINKANVGGAALLFMMLQQSGFDVNNLSWQQVVILLGGYALIYLVPNLIHTQQPS